MNQWKGKVAIVTGASSGIGAAIAEQLVDAEIEVVGLARRKDRLDELAKKFEHKGGKFYGVVCDVTVEDSILEAFKWVKANLGPIHILVNNAGVRAKTNLIDGDTYTWRKLFDTNVLGLCICTREAVKDMRANKVDGHIIHINSIVGHVVQYFPDINVYPATKHAVTALTETLRQELISFGSKIKISSISPGRVITEFRIAAGVPLNPTTLPSLDPKDIADASIYILSTPPHVQVHDMIIMPFDRI